MSTILVDVEVAKGVAKTDAGFEDIGTTVTVVGAVPVKESFTEGKTFVAGISASVTPLAKVATCELGNSPAVMVAVLEVELLTSGTEFETFEYADSPIELIAATRKV